MTPSDGIDRRLDSFLDGDLTDAEMGEFRQALMEDEALRVSVREDLMLSAALEQAGAGAFGERAPAAEAVRAGSHRRLRWSAAAALLVAAFVLGRSMDSGDGAVSPTGVTQVDVVVAEAGDLVVADGSTTREVRVGEARIRVRPGARARVVSTVPPVLTLEQGGLEVESAAPTDVRIAGFGKATTSGSAALLFAAATDRREPYLMVTSFSGDVRVVDGEFTDRVTVGEPRLFDGGGPRLTGDVLARLAELEGDEGLLVLTTAEHAELLSSFDDDKQSLQVRVAELMAERERLEVELAAIKRRTPNQERASLTELVRTTAELAEKEGLDGRDRARWWRRIRAVRRAGRRPGEIVAVIDRELLQPTASTTRHRLGLWFLSQLRSRAGVDILRRFVNDDSVGLRVAAVEGLARQKSPGLKRVLAGVYREDPAVVVRIAAAGGLVSLGEYGEPLEWLLSQYGRRPRHPEGLRRRILARVLAAPLAESKASQYIVDLCLRDGAPLNEQREVVHLLARLGSEDAETTLAFLAESAARPQIRELARRRLDAIEGR